MISQPRIPLQPLSGVLLAPLRGRVCLVYLEGSRMSVRGKEPGKGDFLCFCSVPLTDWLL